MFSGSCQRARATSYLQSPERCSLADRQLVPVMQPKELTVVILLQTDVIQCFYTTTTGLALQAP